LAEPLKNQYGPEIPKQIAAMIRRAHPAFPAKAFLRHALVGYEDLELTQRGWRTADALAATLPSDYPEAIAILLSSLGPKLERETIEGMGTFIYMPHVFFVARYGAEHFEESMAAQHALTQRFTAEFSIRTFIERHPDATLARLRKWATDDSVHVRRLVSEGTRPRLPWAPLLRGFIADPTPVVALLELLKDDPELYVRRSVANNLNDIAKDNPDVVVDVCRRWSVDAGSERAWLIRHGLRTLIKRGNPGALEILGFGAPATVSTRDVQITPANPRIGGSVRIALQLVNDAAGACRVLVDLKVHFVKANGTTSPKVFKLTTADLAPGASVAIRKTVALHQQTTRTHYPGTHRVELLVNGAARPLGSFELVV
jgi:3-methyladenine DNA glycosylase AlkC